MKPATDTMRKTNRMIALAAAIAATATVISGCTTAQADEPTVTTAVTFQPIETKPDEKITSRPALLDGPETRTVHASRSDAARDMKGIKDSLYRGEYYSEKAEKFRLCVIERESRGVYTAANSSSSARGAYQFLGSWHESLVWMLLPEAKDEGLGDEVRALRDKPIHQWNRYWQDAAFFTVVNHEGPLSGAKHWASFGQTYECR